MRKMFTRLFGLTLLMYLASSLTVVKAQCDLPPLTAEDNVVLLTDITTKCDSALIQYAVTGFPSGTEFSFNGYGTTTPGGFSEDSTYWVKEGDGFTVQVRLDTCYSNVLTFEGEDLIKPVSLDTVYVTHPLCANDQGELTVVVDGNEPFKVYYVPASAWVGTGGTYTAYTGTQYQAEPGKKYYIGLESANGCASAEWDSVTVNTAPTELVVLDVNASDPECIGGEVAVTVTGISGGTPFVGGNYKVTVGDSTKLSDGDEVTFMMTAGTYTATVVDSFGCEITSDSVAVVTDPTAVTFDIDIDDVTCAEGANGVIYVHTLAGGSGTTYYAKVEGGAWVEAVNDTVTLSGLVAGYYSVYVKQDTDCDSVGYVNPNNTQNTVSVQAPGEISFNVTVGTITCNGGTTTIAVSNEVGGSGAYEYQLEDEDGVVAAFSATKSWTVPAADDYVVTVRDKNATTCEISSVAYDITEPTLVSISADAVSPTCPGGNDGLIEITANGGNGTYEYSLNGTTWYTNNIFTKEAGVYTAWARDPLCPDQKVSTTVEVDALEANVIEVVFGPGMTDTINECYGVNDNAIVVGKDTWASQVGETRDLTVLISNGTDTMEMPQDEGYWVVENVDPGTYTIWAFDELGCTSNKLEVNVVEVNMLTIEAYVSDNATCYGDNDGVITVKNNGGGNDEWYGYFHTNTLQAAMNLDMSAFITWPEGADSVEVQATKGTYYVVVIDYCGYRTYAGPFTVDGYAPVEIAAEAVSVQNIKCFGDTDGNIVVADATGGSGSLSYTLEVKNGQVWEEVEEWVDTDATTYTGLGAGTYRVVVTDENGCAGDMTGEIVVEGPESGVILEDWYKDDISCYGAADGAIGFAVSGGTAPYEYKVGTTTWQPFPAESYGPGEASEQVLITKPGTYTIQVRDVYGCEMTPWQVTVDEPKEITVIATGTNVTSSCLETPNGTIKVVVDGGNTNLYDVQIVGVDTIQTDSIANFTEVGAGVWNITVVEVGGNGCIGTASVELSAPSALKAEAAVTSNVSCNGGANGGIAVSNITGGVAPYTISISPVAGSVNQTTDVISALPANTYTVIVTDANGCSYEINDQEVTEPTALTLNATKIQDITCAEDGMFSVQVAEGTPDYVYYTAKSDPVTGHVLITDIPTAASTWQADSIFTVTEAGTWVVWAMDANGCIIGGEEDENGPVNEWRVKIEEPEVVVDFEAYLEEEVSCNGDMDAVGVIGDITVNSVTADLADVTITVNGEVVASDTVKGLGAGTYVIVVKDNASGCSHTQTVEIDEPEVLEVVLDIADGEFTCPDVVEGLIQATVTGGTPMNMEKSANNYSPYEFQLWQDGELLSDYNNYDAFVVEIGHEYQVVVRDMNGCTDTSNVLVVDPVAPVVIEEIKDVTCSDDVLASLKVTVSGEEGRQFQVKWRLYEETTTYTVSDWYSAGDIYLSEMFEFDSENINDKHYEIVVVDDMGCTSEKDTVTVDPKPGSSIMLTTTVGEVNGCGTEVMVVAAGGVAPYSYMVNGEVAEGTTLLLGGGTHIIQAMDAHECMDADTITLAYPMSVDTTFNIFVGDTAHLVYGTIDEMFTEDVTATFYDMSDENCTVEVNVEVITREKTAPVLDTVSPMGTITDNHPTFVITFEDEVSFNETGYLTVTAKDSANATLTLTITPEMVSGNTVTVTYDHTVSGGLDKFTTYVVAVDSGVVMGDGLVWDGNVPYAWEFTTGDFATDITDIETVEFKVYPNPFSSFIRIDNAQKLDRVIVSNIAGQRVLDIENPTYEIRTGNLVTGVYVVTLIANDEIVKSERIIKR